MQIISGGDEYIVSAGGRTHEVTGDKTYTVHGDRTISVDGNHTGHSSGLCRTSYVGHTQAAFLSTSMTAHEGLNLELSNSINIFARYSVDIGYSAGLSLVKESQGIKTGVSKIDTSSGPAIKTALLHIFT